jgi:hypothetical protein
MNAQAQPLCKAYIAGWSRREEPEKHICDFFFGSKPDKAAPWPNNTEADLECAFLETLAITIRLRNGRRYICKGFKSEKRANGEFVISCEIPPVSDQIV